MAVNPIPEGYRSVTPYLAVKGASQAIEWYKKAFGAEERMRMGSPDGLIMHAEIQLGDSVVMLADEFPDFEHRGPQHYGGTSVSFMFYVKDVDSFVKTAVEQGATLKREIKNQFYGDRTGTITDPFGHTWTIGTHVEDISEEEMKKRMATMKP